MQESTIDQQHRQQEKMETMTAKMIVMMTNDIALAITAISKNIATILPESLYEYALQNQFAADDLLGVIPFIKNGVVIGLLKDFVDRKIVSIPSSWDEDNITDFQDSIHIVKDSFFSMISNGNKVDLSRLNSIHPDFCKWIIENGIDETNQLIIPVTGYENIDRYKTLSPLIRRDGSGIWVRDYPIAHIFARHLLKVRSFEYKIPTGDEQSQDSTHSAQNGERPPSIDNDQLQSDESRIEDAHKRFSHAMLLISDTMYLAWMASMAMQEDNLHAHTKALNIYEGLKALFGRPLALLSGSKDPKSHDSGGILESLELYAIGSPPANDAEIVRVDDFAIDDRSYRTYLLENLYRYKSSAASIIMQYDREEESIGSISLPIIHDQQWGYTSPIFISEDRAIYFPNVGTAFIYANAELGQPNITGRIQEPG